MTPLMERVILTMQALGGDREISLREIRQAGQFDNGREVAICLHYLVNREELATVREVSGNPARPAVWKLTDLGRLYRPLLTVGEKSDAGTTKPPSRAKPKKGKPAGTVADLVQEIKAEQDLELHDMVLDADRDERARPEPPWLKETCKRFEEAAAAEDAERDPRLVLTLRDDGTLLIVTDGGALHVALSPGQTSQLGEFMTKTAGVWQCPF